MNKMLIPERVTVHRKCRTRASPGQVEADLLINAGRRKQEDGENQFLPETCQSLLVCLNPIADLVNIDVKLFVIESTNCLNNPKPGLLLDLDSSEFREVQFKYQE